MRLSSLVLLAVAVLMGLSAAFLANNWMEAQSALPKLVVAADNNSRKVVVAAQPLRFGNELSAVNLREIDWPSGAVPDGSFTSTGDLLKPGERRVALAAIERDEPVLSWKVTGPGQRGSLSAIISNEMKAVTIRVNDVFGVAGFVLPGDRVDVLLTRNEDKSGFTDVLLQGVRTLAVDQLADEKTDKPSVVKAVTLEVSTGDAQKLALASTVGSLSLALRSAGAASQEPARRIGIADLGESSAPPASPPPVVVIKSEPAPPPPVKPRITVVGVTRAIDRKEYSVKPEGIGGDTN